MLGVQRRGNLGCTDSIMQARTEEWIGFWPTETKAFRHMHMRRKNNVQGMSDTSVQGKQSVVVRDNYG